MNEKIKNILVEEVSLEWLKFARYTCFVNDGLESFIDELDKDDTVVGNKSKMEKFIEKLYQYYLDEYLDKIKDSLELMPRKDVLKKLKKVILIEFNKDFFMECFFEAQTIITNELKQLIANEKQEWWLEISDINNPWRVTQQKYFFEKFIEAGMKLDRLYVHKNILSENERQLFIKCSTKVHCIIFYCPLMIKDWKPSDPVEQITISIADSYVSIIDFRDFIPWFPLCKQLFLSLHRDTDFIKDICDWIRGCTNIELLEIKYRGEEFYNTDDLEN